MIWGHHAHRLIPAQIDRAPRAGSEHPMTEADPQSVSPKQMLAALEDAGFTVYSQGAGGFYVRMQWPAGSPQYSTSLLVPLDQTAPEYPKMMEAVLRELAKAATAGRAATQVLKAV